jgi:hypothetical protein
MFKTIRHISDVEPAVSGKKEITLIDAIEGRTLA